MKRISKSRRHGHDYFGLGGVQVSLVAMKRGTLASASGRMKSIDT